MGSLRHDLAPFYPHHDHIGNGVSHLPHEVDEEDEWTEDEDDAMILGTTPHVTPPPPPSIAQSSLELFP